MVKKGQSFVWCGATVISDEWILTAAHCTDGQSASSIQVDWGRNDGGVSNHQVLLGEHDYSSDSETASLRMDVTRIVQHSSYNSQTTDYDFSLLKMASKVNFADYTNIRPACLPAAGDVTYADFISTVTGR